MSNKLKTKNLRSFTLIVFFLLTSLLTIKTFKGVNDQNIRIYGTELFSIEDIINNCSIKFPTKLIFVRTKYLEEELKINLSLKNISINREIFPFGLKIFIETRTPIAYAERIFNKKKISGFVDEDGFFIHEKYSDFKKQKNLSIKVYGWSENFKEVISKILKSQKNNDLELNSIIFSPNGFLTLEEKSLEKILLGFDSKLIDTQLEILSNIKKQLDQKKIITKIDNLDLTDPINPKIKVFKP